MDKNLTKLAAEKKIYFFLTGREQPPALQNMKFLNFFYFCGSYLTSWIRIRIPDQDPLAPLNPDPIRFRIRNPAYTVTVNGYCCAGSDPVPGRDHRPGSQALPGWTEHLQCLLHSQVLNLLTILLTEVYKHRLCFQMYR
jgi:hypothetical protein